MITKIKAKVAGAPHKVDGLWPYGVSVMDGGMYTNALKLEYSGFRGRIKNGDVIPLLSGEGKLHHYKLMRSEYMQGGDWGGVSNRKFWFEYSHSERLPPSPDPSP
jgi:hypothetical protein